MNPQPAPIAPADATFHEVQRFRKPWLLAVVVGVAGVLIGLATYGLIVQFVFGRPFGREPLTATQLVLMAAFMIAIGCGLLWLVVAARLETWVTPDGLHVKFSPFHRKPRVYSAADIESAEARTYRPLAEYGGWGIRMGRQGHAYNVSGDRGLQLLLRGGKRLLIGSARTDELATAVAKLRQRQA